MIKELLTDAKASGLSFHVSYEGETDYSGKDIDKALTALYACDEIELRLVKDGEVVGWALFIPGPEEEECIADCSGWPTDWWDERINGFLGKIPLDKPA